jgi:hypothetical protein
MKHTILKKGRERTKTEMDRCEQRERERINKEVGDL